MWSCLNPTQNQVFKWLTHFKAGLIICGLAALLSTLNFYVFLRIWRSILSVAGVMSSLQSLFVTARQRVSGRPYLWVFIVLLLWTLIVRLPFLHVIHDDEAFYSVVASRWLNGEPPYIASYDIKAPGIFAILAGFQVLFGAHLIVIKAVEMLTTLWGAFGLFRLVAHASSRRLALLVAALYPLYSLFLMGVSSPTQLIEAAFTIEAFAQIGRVEGEVYRKHLIALALAALMMGGAVMVKQTAAFTALGLFGWVAWHSWRQRDFKSLALFCVMGAVPTIAFGLYFAAIGHFRDAFDTVVLTALDRSQVDMSEKPDTLHLGFLLRLWHFPAFYKPMLVITVGALLAVMRLPRLKTALSSSFIHLIIIWYMTAVAGILVNQSLVIWYGFTLVPPTLILFCAVLYHGIGFKAQWRVIGIGLYLLAAVIQPFVVEGYTLFNPGPFGPPDYRGNVRAAESLKANGLKPGDNLLVTGRGHYVYLMAGALPKAKYFNAMHLMCTFPTPDKDPLAVAFSTQPDFLVVSDRGFFMGCRLPEREAAITDELARHYRAVSRVSGDWDNFTIYRRKP